jgi:hypothetical protein
MKKFLLTFLLLLIIATSANAKAASITFTWDPSTGITPTGYKLYWGTSSRTYSINIDVGNVTTYTWSNLDVTAGGTFYSTATAYLKDANGKLIESGYSNEVSIQFPKIPGNFKYTILISQ